MIKFNVLSFLGLLILTTVMMSSCTEDVPSSGFELSDIPLPRLSDYGMFTEPLNSLEPTAALLPYDLNTPLFSDYSVKERFVYLPEGEKASFTNEGVLDFPIGTILFKNFSFYLDYTDYSKGRRILETRLLVHQPEGWLPYSYIWNEAQSEADYKVTGGPTHVEWIHTDGNPRETFYLIPNQIECENCHQIGDPLLPIGPKARNLNRDFDYADGSSMNQLEKWVLEGILESVPDVSGIPTIASWTDPTSGTLDERARGYLDINCAHCHRPEGDAENSGLYLNIENADLTALGLCKPPIAAGSGSGGLFYGIVPGKPDSSILHYRMNSTELDVAMPELGRSVIHDEGLQLIREWIEDMDPSLCD
jgi:uncharacterized repeat protein (TIGR03806 family)